MADPKETQTQFDLEQQINKVLQDRQSILKAQEKALSGQVQLAVDLCKALKCEQLDEIESKLKTAREEMQKAAEDATRLGGSMGDAGKKAAEAAGSSGSAFEKLASQVTAGKAATVGFGAGIMQFGGIFLQTFKNVLSMAGGLVATLGKVGFAIFTLPFKLLGGLFDLAQGSGGGGPSPTAQALEKIRGELGGLNTAVGKAAASSLPQFRAQLRDMAGTGLSVRKVFGQGREGLAKAMEYTLELFKALGPAASAFANVLKQSAVELAMYRKGLGITAEQQAQMMKQALAVGRDPVDAQREFASMAIQMGEQFGESASAIGKDMAEMKSDFANFGTLSVRELGQAAIYARKLGIAVKDLQGLIGGFDDFETAAQNAAKLSQSFGMNVDAMKMMNAQNPAERLSMLQKAFRETGRSVEQMSRQELKLLATQSGISEEAASLAFSQRGLSMSYDQVQKAGAKAEKKQLTQAEAMSKLADSIERVFGSGGGSKFTSFFDAFSKGFQRGILRSKEILGLFRDIRRSFKVVYWAGVSVGKMFVQMFPGIQKMIAGLRDVFNPARFSAMMEKVRTIFSSFFKDLQTDPKAGVEKFIERMKDAFKSFFGGQGSGVKTFIEGGKTFLKTIGAIFMAVAPMVLEGLVKAIDAIADFLESPPQIPGAISALGTQIWESLVHVFDVLKDRLWPPVKRMLMALWDQVAPWLEETAYAVFYASLAKAFLRGTVAALGGAAIALVKDKLMAIFKSVPTPPAAPAGGAGANPAAAARQIPGLVTFMGAVLTLIIAFGAVALIYKGFNLKPEDALAIGVVVVALAGAAAMMSVALKFVPDNVEKDASKLGAVLLIMAAAGVVAVGVMAVLAQVEAPSAGQILAFTSVMTTLVFATLPLLAGAMIVGQMQSQTGKALIGMGIIGIFMTAVGYVGARISEMLSDIPDPQGVGTLMESISSIMRTTMLMLPVALALGLLAGAAPFGPIGLAAMVGGFEIIAGLATLLIATLMPTIRELSRITIANPESFKAVTGALLGIMQAINEFMVALVGLSFMLRPTGTNIKSDAFEKNINAFKGLIEAILDSGVGEIMNRLMRFAKTANVKEGTGEVISAIAAVMSSVGQVMQAFAPDGEVLRSMAAASPGILEVLSPIAMIARVAQTKMILDSMKEFQKGAARRLIEVLPSITATVVELLGSLGDIPPGAKDVAPFVQGIATLFSAVANIMKALSPSDAAWKAVEAGSGFFSDDYEDTLETMKDQMNRVAKKTVKVFQDLKQPLLDLMVGLMSALQPIIDASRTVNPETLSSVAQILGSVLGAVGTIVGVVSPMIAAASEQASGAKTAASKSLMFSQALNDMTSLFSNIAPSLQSMIVPMQDMVMAMINIANGITNPKGLKEKIEIVRIALEAMGSISQIFGPDGPFAGESSASSMMSTIPTNLISGMVDMMNQVSSELLGSSGPLQNVINMFSSLKLTDPRGVKAKAEAVTSVLTGVQTISSALQSMNASGVSLVGQANTFLTSTGNGTQIAEAIRVMSTIVSAAPASMSGASDRVRAVADAYNSLSLALKTPLDQEDVRTIVDIAESMRGQKSLTVRHENVNINVSVDVHVDAVKVGEAILDRNNRINERGRAFATQPAVSR